MLRVIVILLLIGSLVSVVRPHGARDNKCVEYKYATVSLYQSRFVDFEWPWAQICVKRYNPTTQKVELVPEKR